MPCTLGMLPTPSASCSPLTSGRRPAARVRPLGPFACAWLGSTEAGPPLAVLLVTSVVAPGSKVATDDDDDAGSGDGNDDGGDDAPPPRSTGPPPTYIHIK